jgi:hypothetical protein
MRPLCRTILAFLLIFTALAAGLGAQVPLASSSEPWSNDVHTFAEKISAAVKGVNAISLDVKNISTVDANRVSAIEQQLRQELGRGGLQIQPRDSAESSVDVTLSEDIEGYLWIAQISDRRTSGNQVVMLTVGRPPTALEDARPAPVLRKTILLQQQDAMLDFAEIATPTADEEPRRLLLLEPDRIAVLQENGGAWVVRDSAPIRHSVPWPRDLRGQISATRIGDFQAFLPGVVCTGNLAPLSVSCREGADATWPLQNTGFSFVANRDYFINSPPGVGKPETDVPIAYSVALDLSGDALRWIISGADGGTRLFKSSESSWVSLGKWGDEIASVKISCGGKWEVLATGAGDWTQRDYLQAYEISDSNATSTGQALGFSGPILTLWSNENRNAVRTVSRNLETGMYEASIVSVSCGN